jgi:hypothetical protein
MKSSAGPVPWVGSIARDTQLNRNVAIKILREAMAEHLTVKDAFALYEEGKASPLQPAFLRYGGAFAVAKLLTGEPGKRIVWVTSVSLSCHSECCCSPLVMTWDIFAFGLKMRRKLSAGAFETQARLSCFARRFDMSGVVLVGLRGSFFA